MIALSLLLSTNNVFAEPLSIEEMRPAQDTTLHLIFRKYRKIEGPYSFVGYGLQLTPLPNRTAFSISHQLIRVNKRSSFEFGLRLGEGNPEQGLSFEDRESMYFNEEGEYVQNVFWVDLIFSTYITSINQQKIEFSELFGHRILISRHSLYFYLMTMFLRLFAGKVFPRCQPI